MPAHVLKRRWGPSDGVGIDVTSGHGRFGVLSPFHLGPVPLYDGHWSQTMENGWQYAKLYPQHDTATYWPWAEEGWANKRAVRYPMGRGARPTCSLWAGDGLDYIEARKRIYIPLFAWAVRFYQLSALTELKVLAQSNDVMLRDYDAYDHRALGYSWDDVINDPERKMGHGFVLAMMIEGHI